MIKKLIRNSIFLAICLLQITGCKEDTSTINDVMTSNYDVEDIISSIRLDDDLLACMYTTLNDNMNLVVNVAFLEGNDKKGWKIIDDDGWSKYNHDELEVYYDSLVQNYDNKLLNYSIVYGLINNLSINNIEVELDKRGYKNADVLEKNGQKYFYIVYELGQGDTNIEDNSATTKGHTFNVRGYLDNEELVFELKGKE